MPESFPCLKCLSSGLILELSAYVPVWSSDHDYPNELVNLSSFPGHRWVSVGPSVRWCTNAITQQQLITKR